MPATAAATSDSQATLLAPPQGRPAAASAKAAHDITLSARTLPIVVSGDYAHRYQSELTTRSSGDVWRCSPPVHPRLTSPGAWKEPAHA